MRTYSPRASMTELLSASYRFSSVIHFSSVRNSVVRVGRVPIDTALSPSSSAAFCAFSKRWATPASRVFSPRPATWSTG